MFLGIDHPTPRDDTVRLGPVRRIVGYVSLLIPIFCLSPIPVWNGGDSRFERGPVPPAENSGRRPVKPAREEFFLTRKYVDALYMVAQVWFPIPWAGGEGMPSGSSDERSADFSPRQSRPDGAVRAGRRAEVRSCCSSGCATRPAPGSTSRPDALPLLHRLEADSSSAPSGRRRRSSSKWYD